jgi:hypothetical protein
MNRRQDKSSESFLEVLEREIAKQNEQFRTVLTETDADTEPFERALRPQTPTRRTQYAGIRA